MGKWKDCVKEPSEEGKKVLCQRNGDFYVAMRLEEFYIPIPFVDHYYSLELCYPETWCEIDFPEPYTGYLRVTSTENYDRPSEWKTLKETKETMPEAYWDLFNALVGDLGSLKNKKRPGESRYLLKKRHRNENRNDR